MLVSGLISLITATLLWHSADVFMLRAFEAGQQRAGLLWVLLHLLSVPLFAFSSYAFFRVQRVWWIVELPYLVTGLLVSAVLFRSTLQLRITWREILAAALVVAAAAILASGPAQPGSGSAVDRPDHERSNQTLDQS